jgi:hypothetical protein
MEDYLNIFENERRPEITSIGRRPQYFSRQPKKLIFGMQPYFDPTKVRESQRRSEEVKESQRRSEKVREGQRRSEEVREGQRWSFKKLSSVTVVYIETVEMG